MTMTSLSKPMHAHLKLIPDFPKTPRLDFNTEEFEDALSVIETYIDPEPGESFRSMVYRMAGRCEERITSLEQAAGRIAVAWNHFQSGVPSRYSMEPAVRAFEQYIGEQWP